MYGVNKSSNKTRYFLVLSHGIIIILVWWIYFGNAFVFIGSMLSLNLALGDFLRRLILFIFSIIYFIRMDFTLFSFLKRDIPWKETGAIVFALVFYQVGFALSGFAQNLPLGLIDVIPFGLFIVGSYLNSFSEYQRKRFKQKPENKGKLYTQGLFKHAQHVNYFGDFVWILGFALFTWNLWAFIMPALCIISFIFFNIPMLDTYLKEKYKDEFEAWNKRTKKLIPYIY